MRSKFDNKLSLIGLILIVLSFISRSDDVYAIETKLDSEQTSVIIRTEYFVDESKTAGHRRY